MLGCAALGDEYVTACRAQYNVEVESAVMPVSLWTNTVFWLTAESPVVNSGTTNAQWICYARNCAGNSTQPLTNSQPVRISTNGLLVLKFDGLDDWINTVTAGVRRVEIHGRFIVTNGLQQCGIIKSLNPGRFYFGISDGLLGATSKSAYISSSYAPGTNFHVFVYDSIAGVLSVDGTNILTGLDFSGLDIDGVPFGIGRRNGVAGAGSNYANMEITKVIIR